MTYLSITCLKIQSFKKLQNWKLERVNNATWKVPYQTNWQVSHMQVHEDKFAFIWYIWGSYRISHMKIIPIFEKRILTYLWSQPFQVRNNQLVCNRLFCKVWRKVKVWRIPSVGENFYHEINLRNEAFIHFSLENSNVTLLHIIYTANLEDLTASVNHTS